MRVGLFVTCLVDLMRPRIGFAALELLKDAGCEVVVPETQTCCGQPGYNSGDRASTVELARKVAREFAGCDYVVAPSGSCGGMIKTHYPELLAGDPANENAARVKITSMADGGVPSRFNTARVTASVFAQISSGSCSTQPSRGKI